MKIVVATGLYPPQIGGPATYAKLLKEKLPQRGFEVLVVNFGGVLSYPKGVRQLIYFFKLWYVSRKAECVYALDPVSVGFPSLLVALIRRKRFLVRVAGDYAWEQGVQRSNVTDDLSVFSKKQSGYGFLVGFLKKIETLVARRADMVIVPSEYLKTIVSNWGVSKRHIKVVFSVFEGVSPTGNKAALRTMLGFDGKLIVSAGRLVPWKGFDTLITLMPDIVKAVPDTKLIIAGEGVERENLEALIEKYNLKDTVVLTGSLRQDILHSYIRAADVFVLNTGYEGFSHLLLEVLALETPLITTAAGGNPELVRDGEEALLVSYNDIKALTHSLTHLLTDTTLQTMLTQKGKKRLTLFSEETMLAQLSKVLKTHVTKK